MGRKRKHRRNKPVEPSPSPRKLWILGWLGAFLVGALVSAVVVASMRNGATTGRAASSGGSLPSLAELAFMSGDELEAQDMALMNLRCAEGLPGSESLDTEACLATLDKWTAWVKHETNRHLYKYRRNPAEYENSQAYFRMLMLITVLQQDFKVHYNPERIREIDFTKPQDLFIHGMIDSDNGGTCVSMPVLYTAVARRLGYPVYLVTAKAHVFCRWDSKEDRFNIEATNQGMNSFGDAYYMTWPKPISEAEVKAGHFLKSLNATESLAMFLAARGHCLEDTGNLSEARVAYAMASEKAPKHPIYRAFLAGSVGIRSMPLASSELRPPNIPLYRGNLWGPQQGVNPASYQQPHNVFKPAVPFSANPFQQPPNSQPNFGFQQGL